MRSTYKKETRIKVMVSYKHEGIEKILAHHAAEAKNMRPEDVTVVNLEGGDALCEATVCLESVEVDDDA